MITELEEPQTAVVVSILPVDQLAEINATDKAIDQMLETARTLSADDKDSYTITHNFCVMAMRTRKNIERIGDDIINPKKAEIKTVSDEVKRLVGRIREAEDIARPLKEGYEEREKERKAEIERQALVKIHNRTQQVINLGMTFTGHGYELDQFTVEPIEIKAAPDDQWDTIVAEVSDWVEQTRLAKIEAERIAEEERQAEQLRLENQRKEQEEQQRKFDEERAEFQRQQAAFQQQQEEAQAELKKIKDAKDAITLKSRVDRLTAIGVTCTENGVFIGDKFIYDNKTLLEQPDADFDLDVADFIVGIATRNEQAEAKRLQDEKDEAERIAQQERAQANQKRADRERANRLKPEQKLFLAHLSKLGKTAHPKPSQPEMSAIVGRFSTAFTKLVNEFSTETIDL